MAAQVTLLVGPEKKPEKFGLEHAENIFRIQHDNKFNDFALPDDSPYQILEDGSLQRRRTSKNQGSPESSGDS